MDSYPVTSVAEYVAAVEKWTSKETVHDHLRFLFRGHSDAAWTLTPGASRKTPLTEYKALLTIGDERNMFRDFKLWSAGLLPLQYGDTDLYFQQQHHGLPTRLLDWTTNALVALYFAVEEMNDKDAEVFGMDAYRFSKTEYTSRDGKTKYSFTGFATAHHPALTLALDEIFSWNDTPLAPNFIFPVRPAFTDSTTLAHMLRFRCSS